MKKSSNQNQGFALKANYYIQVQFHPHWKAVLVSIWMCFTVFLTYTSSMFYCGIIWRLQSWYTDGVIHYRIHHSSGFQERTRLLGSSFSCSLLWSTHEMLCRYVKNGATPTESCFAAGFQNKREDLLQHVRQTITSKVQFSCAHRFYFIGNMSCWLFTCTAGGHYWFFATHVKEDRQTSHIMKLLNSCGCICHTAVGLDFLSVSQILI